MLWDKKIGNGQDLCIAGCIEQTHDGGFAVSGLTDKYTWLGDPFIMKFNACGEVEWCTVIKLGGTDDYAISVKQTPTNEYVLLTIYSDPNPNHHTQLYKFDSTGGLIWRQDYPTQGNAFEDTPSNLRIDSSMYIITGDCYYPDPGHPGGYERPYYICTDTAGNVNWRLVYGAVNGFHGFPFFPLLKSSTGFFYDITWHSNYCDTPALIKFTESGEESYYQDLYPGACPGGNGEMNFLNDTTLVVFVGGTLNGADSSKWMKADTFGVSKFNRFFTESWITGTRDALITQGNKIVSISKQTSTFHFYRLNSTLEFDSIYTMPRTYDSLCPYQIVSDTVDPDCGLIVSIKEPEEFPESYQLKVYPNPAINTVTVEVPEFLQKRSGPAGFQATTTYHQWGSAILEAYDLYGRKLLERVLMQADRKMEVEVSAWPRGMVVFRLSYRGETVVSEKVVME